MSTPVRISPATLKDWLHDGDEIALIDVREAGEFADAHLFYAVCIPYSRLELEIRRLVPRPGVRLVLCDDGRCGAVEMAAARLAPLGYTGVHILDGGTAAWEKAGHQLFSGVNLPSKTFGELVEHACHTPRITAKELAAMQARGDDLVILDGRTVAEFRRFNIPGGISCPNGELALRVDEVVKSPTTRIVINCAGRTRSIIGAQTLINLGLPNEIVALENGTQGWMLADLTLENGADRRITGAPRGERLEAALKRARALAERFQVPFVPAATVAGWLGEPNRTTFLCDVRTPEEYKAGSLAGAQSTPGGQLIQATDLAIGVRGARVVLFDGEGVRAPVVASWLMQMGWDVAVLEEGLAAKLPAPAVAEASWPAVPPIDVTELRDILFKRGGTLIDLRPSMTYRKGQLATAVWSSRRLLADLKVSKGLPVVLIAEEPAIAALAAMELAERGVPDVRRLRGTLADWEKAGMTIERTPASPPDAECIDFVFHTHRRHEGDKAHAQAYIDWEVNLVHQIDERERKGFRV